MSVDSYFFAAFQDGDRALAAIQQRLDERPNSDLPRLTPSDLSLQIIPTSESDTHLTSHRESSTGPLGIKKLGSVLKPLISKSIEKTDDADSSDSKTGFSIPFRIKSHKASHDSLETLRTESIGPQDEDSDGYPPKQSGPPPRGMQHDSGKGWTGWVKKPVTKIFGSSPNQCSSHVRSSPEPSLNAGLTDTPTKSAKTSRDRNKRTSVTEIIVPAVPNGTDDESSGEERTHRPRQKSNRRPRDSFASEASSGSQMPHNHSEYSMLEESESGNREDAETAKKFRNVFSLSEKEELLERACFDSYFPILELTEFTDFPGYLYRVLPVSGRFFISTNYFCFRSSQLLYKTKVSWSQSRDQGVDPRR